MLEHYSALINRLSEKRSDTEWIGQELQSVKSLFVPVHNMQLLFLSPEDFKPVFITRTEIASLNISITNHIFLGTSNGTSYFVLEINDKDVSLLKDLGMFAELRKALLYLNDVEREILLQARAMVYWHSRHKFCGTCGSPTTNKEAGNLLVCSNEECGLNHFPRTDPAIIVLVNNGDKCLLGHNKAWPGNRYSTLAGFVEPGESLEDAVRREVFEESGIIIENIKYVSSQPWPFPSSLMVGFTAEAINENIVTDNHEIEHAAWFSREEIKTRLLNKTIKMPTRISIAFKLVSSWFDKGGLGMLSEIAGED